MDRPNPLAGQTAWITGSSRGLGRVMAEELCRQGAKVAVHGTRPDSPRQFGEGESMEQVARDIASETGGETIPCWGELTDQGEVKRVADEVRNQLGAIDILVCCAGGDIGAGGTASGRGGMPDHDDPLNISLDDLHAVMNRNLMTAILCCREVAPEMIERQRGRLVTIGSVAGLFGRPTGSTYCVAKAAVHEYTRCLAARLRPHNIPVNCVAPGGTISQRFLAIHDIDDAKTVEGGTLERYGRAIEIARVVAFLCGPGGEFISGQVIRVDGGNQTFPC